MDVDSQLHLTNALIGQRVPELIRMRLRFAPAASDGAAVISGDHALVTRLHHAGGGYRALRVAIDRREAVDWPRHYDVLAGSIPTDLGPYLPQRIEPIAGGITLAGAKIPAILMEWIDGPTLFEAADEAASEGNRVVLMALADAVREMSAALAAARVTHGDLAPDNLMMRSTGELVCVDLDTLQWPGMRVRSTQGGSPAYRHPRPGAIPRHHDAFATLVMLTSLSALADAPDLRDVIGHDVDVHGGGLLFSSWDLTDPGTSRAFSLVRERASARTRRMLELLARSCESEPYRTAEMLSEAASLPLDAPAPVGPASSGEETESWDLAQVIDRLRAELGEGTAVAPAHDPRPFAETWPSLDEPGVEEAAPPPMVDTATDEPALTALEREERALARFQSQIGEAVRRNDDAAIAKIGREIERRELPMDPETRRVVRIARERIAIRSRLERALGANDRSALAEMAQSGDLVVLGDTDRESLMRVLQALEWPGLLRAIEADDDAIILEWYDEELFGGDALPPEMRARVDLARERTRWVAETRAILKKRDSRALEAQLAEEPEGGLERLSRSERGRVLRLIEQRAALNDLHAALHDADTARILTALSTIERVGARIENPATWAAVQTVLERATLIEQIIDAADADPPDDRQLAHLLPVAKTMGIARDPALQGEYALEQLEAAVLRGAAVRRIRAAIAADDDQAIRQAAWPDVTGAVDMLTDEERERLEQARARRQVANPSR